MAQNIDDYCDKKKWKCLFSFRLFNISEMAIEIRFKLIPIQWMII